MVLLKPHKSNRNRYKRTSNAPKIKTKTKKINKSQQNQFKKISHAATFAEKKLDCWELNASVHMCIATVIECLKITTAIIITKKKLKLK